MTLRLWVSGVPKNATNSANKPTNGGANPLRSGVVEAEVSMLPFSNCDLPYVLSI
jgi:hypothetical protein